MKMPPLAIQASIEKICIMCEVVTIQKITVINAIKIHEKYRYSFFDSLMIASALESECAFFLSEDMVDGQVIESRLIIKNIFCI